MIPPHSPFFLPSCAPIHLQKLRIVLLITSVAFSAYASNVFAAQAPQKPSRTTQKKKNIRNNATSMSPEQLLKYTNQLYLKRQYKRAIQFLAPAIQQLKKRGWEHFALHYNLGNAYFQTQQWGKALAAYRRAQRLQPNAQTLLHNLELLQQQVRRNHLKQAPWSAYQLPLLNAFSLHQIWMLLTLLLGCTCMGWGIWFWKKRQQRHQGLPWPAILLSFATLLLSVQFGAQYFQQVHLRYGAVHQSKLTARSGYSSEYEALFVLEQADEVRILKMQRDWTLIERLHRTKNKTPRQGWVPTTSITPI
ncbi:MAG: tetratricopeptide repeat protein [Myxococcota bacterium]